jgi:bifunctional non-homologous end joining protein LigD
VGKFDLESLQKESLLNEHRIRRKKLDSKEGGMIMKKDLLKDYNRKRDFKITKEPSGKKKVAAQKRKKLSFVIQEHYARRLHYDFRLEWEGVLKSWAVPKGPSLDPGDKRLAVQTEDHPLEYGKFHGTIPEGEYGAGEVFIWDKGTWEPIGDPEAGLKKGHLEFHLNGDRLQGNWLLIRTNYKASEDKKNWLLIKRTDEKSSKKKTGKRSKKLSKLSPKAFTA